MRERFGAVVESATGRRVVGSMSGNQQNPDILYEIFILADADRDEEATPDPGRRFRVGAAALKLHASSF